MLQRKRILLAITGSIAAYKMPLLVRLLKKAGADVQVIMTPDAVEFVTPLTLATLSENPVYHQFIKSSEGEWTNHVALALWADLILVAPASANTIAKMAHGLCDNLVMATLLSAKCPVAVAPAMDLDMYKHTATQNNLKILTAAGYDMIAPASGSLASGLVGEGRMQEPEVLFQYIENLFTKALPLKGKKALVTAGPTYEALDPVRFIGNHSSGKMGVALAQELAGLGAEVMLVLGPNSLNEKSILDSGVQHVKQVISSDDMALAVFDFYPHADITIMSAAVADYKPAEVQAQKIKKKDSEFNLALIKTQDILSVLGSKKQAHQLLVGFALETNDEEAHAFKKLESKNLDFIVLNKLNDEGAGFGHDTNKITIIDKDNTLTTFALKTKAEVAKDIVQHIISKLNHT
jgi:phosphopantothenoylcysteine decarboxylase/phosphopantothenate--cysteine ligase